MSASLRDCQFRHTIVAAAFCLTAFGCSGKTGSMGPRGLPGEDGLDAPDAGGETGQAGNGPIDGVDGMDGVDGTDGADGMDGENGASGEDGEDGADGTNGTDGTDGMDGMDGMDGVDATPRPIGLSLSFVGRHSTGLFDAGGSEIITYDAATSRVFAVNASTKTVDVIDVTDPAAPVFVESIDVTAGNAALGPANSVAVHQGVLAVAVEAVPKTDPGIVAFYDASLTRVATVTVGALPDMLTFTPDGAKILVANEGEPDDTYAVDPPGSVSIISVPIDLANTAPTVQTASFTSFDGTEAALKAAGVRIFGLVGGVTPSTASQDLEPEYIALSADGSTAWVTLQENNAIAVLDVASATVTAVRPLGFKNHALLGNELDVNDQDKVAVLKSWPVFGMYQPDAIAAYEVAGQTYLLTANEGDAREWGPIDDPIRVSNAAYVLDPTVFPNAAELKLNANLGRLNVSKYLGDTDNDGDFDRIYAFGGRSFSIWRAATGELVYDSGNQFELVTAQRHGANFNSTHTKNTGEDRSDDKGPEPEALTIATIERTTFAFIGLERIGGVMIYDITLPESPRFVSYFNSRDWSAVLPGDLATAGDLGPESVLYVPAANPGEPGLLALGNEVSGTTAFYSVTPLYGVTP